MKDLFLVLMIAAAPCSAQVNDQASAAAALGGATAKERLSGIQFLAKQRTPEAYEALSAHFQSEPDAYLRVQIVEAMDINASTWAYNCAFAAADDQNKAVRAAAVPAIAPLAGTPQGYKKLKALAADTDEAVKMTLINSLSVDTSTSSIALIGAVVSDKKGSLKARRFAADRLAGMNVKAADDELLKHLSDPDQEIKAIAASLKHKKTSK